MDRSTTRRRTTSIDCGGCVEKVEQIQQDRRQGLRRDAVSNTSRLTFRARMALRVRHKKLLKTEKC
jgi:hypothetical protein